MCISYTQRCGKLAVSTSLLYVSQLHSVHSQNPRTHVAPSTYFSQLEQWVIIARCGGSKCQQRS